MQRRRRATTRPERASGRAGPGSRHGSARPGSGTGRAGEDRSRAPPASRRRCARVALRHQPATDARRPSARSSAGVGPADRSRPGRTRRPRWSPRPVAGPPALRRPAIASAPRRTCSWSLVSSRHSAPAGRSAPQASARSRSVAGGPAGRLEQDRRAVVRGDAREALPSLAALAAAGTPRTPSAAPGCRSPRAPRAPPRRPGWAPPRRPPPTHALTSSPPGSLTSGVPASVTRATSSPARSRARSSASAPVVALGVVADQRRARCRDAPTAGGSAACPRPPRPPPTGASRSRAAVMSPRLPMGVATTYRVPRPSAPAPSATRSSADGGAGRGSRCPAVRGPTLAMGGIWRLNSAPATMPVHALDHRAVEAVRDHLVDGPPPVHEPEQDAVDGRRRRSRPRSRRSGPATGPREGALRTMASGTPMATDSWRTWVLYRSRDGREGAGAVAEQGRVADERLGLVAGADDQPAPGHRVVVQHHHPGARHEVAAPQRASRPRSPALEVGVDDGADVDQLARRSRGPRPRPRASSRDSGDEVR